ncbi:FAD-dependent monooxygenase [Streptomyces sp. NPDC020875]|uniref:FAD-dependent monooxygenase n=1 Tax=Streptomyces sp. NPDC020875 TaxID=3154898 RepID=UPI0033D524CB
MATQDTAGHGGPGTDTGTDTDTDTDADVVVVGAGPTGLLLAGDLAAAGVRTVLLERRPPGLSNLTRAFGVHARTLELLDARALADELVATGLALGSLRPFRRLEFDLTRLRTRFPFILITPQYEVERLLERRARDAGADIRYGTGLAGLRQNAAGVVAETSDGTGAAGELTASYLVGTDGARSTVRRRLGLPFPGGSVIRSMVLADVRLAAPPEGLPTVGVTDDTIALILPFGDGWYRVMGWDRDRQPPDSEPVDAAEVRELTRRTLGSDFGMGEPRWLSRFSCDERQVPDYRDRRVFLAGDAAHIHSPAGGQGLNTGLQDAANLSWRLAAAVRGRAADPDVLLDGYHAERYPVGRTVIRSSGVILRLAMAGTPLRRAARTVLAGGLAALPPVARQGMGQVTGLGIAYPAPRGSHPLTGRRAPDLALREGRLYELLRTGDFVLVTPVHAVPADHPGVCRAHWRDPERDLELLIRPDGYIAWASRHPDAGSLRSALRRWAGPE